MRLFVSWSGEPSRRTAEVLRRLLPCILHDVDIFMSQHDIGSGRRWAHELSTQLEQAEFGIICLTRDNIKSSWLLFEAGALAKQIEGRVCCLLLQQLRPNDVTGPLAQFQNRPFVKTEFRALIADINAALRKPLTTMNLDLVFEKFWKDIERDVTAAVVASPSSISPRRRESDDVLEEILTRLARLEQLLGSQRSPGPPIAPCAKDARDIDARIHELTEAQRSILKEFVDSDGAPVPQSTAGVEHRFKRSDIDALVEAQLVERISGGFLTVQRRTAQAIAKSKL